MNHIQKWTDMGSRYPVKKCIEITLSHPFRIKSRESPPFSSDPWTVLSNPNRLVKPCHVFSPLVRSPLIRIAKDSWSKLESPRSSSPPPPPSRHKPPLPSCHIHSELCSTFQGFTLLFSTDVLFFSDAIPYIPALSWNTSHQRKSPSEMSSRFTETETLSLEQ